MKIEKDEVLKALEKRHFEPVEMIEDEHGDFTAVYKNEKSCSILYYAQQLERIVEEAILTSVERQRPTDQSHDLVIIRFHIAPIINLGKR